MVYKLLSVNKAILYKICSSVFFLHARHSVLVLSLIVLWYMSILLNVFFFYLRLSYQASQTGDFLQKNNLLSIIDQSTWSTSWRVRGKLTCLFFLLFYEGNFFLIMCAVFLFLVSVTQCIEKAKKLDFHPWLQSSQLLIILMFIITKVCFLFVCLFLAVAGRWKFHHKIQFWKVDSCPFNVAGFSLSFGVDGWDLKSRHLGNGVPVTPSSISWKSRRLNIPSSRFFSRPPAVNENPWCWLAILSFYAK